MPKEVTSRSFSKKANPLAKCPEKMNKVDKMVYCLEYHNRIYYKNGRTFFGGIAFHRHLGVVPHNNGEIQGGEEEVVPDDVPKGDDDDDYDSSDAEDDNKPGTERRYLGVKIRCNIHEGHGFSCRCHFCSHRDSEGQPLSRRGVLCQLAHGRILNITKTSAHQAPFFCSSDCKDKHDEILDGEAIPSVEDTRFTEFDGELTKIFCGGHCYQNSSENLRRFDILTEADGVPTGFEFRHRLHPQGLPY